MIDAVSVERGSTWILYRPSLWPVFRDFTARQQLTITGKGVSGTLRSSRATANPFAIDQFHPRRVENPERKEDPTPLRGGVDWPFQSPKVYEELIGAPDTGSLTVEGLAFGSLGGAGRQTAEFNNGKTLSISETTQGRLDSVTVIRIGRIAMLWNRARHVIVYERCTRRAPRYAVGSHETGKDTWELQSEEFEGMAALRKVREYVEITERTRRYPDTSTSRPLAGPLVASFFETSVIPVRSSWGYDVDAGFVIALRGPLTRDEDPFFLFPKVFLKQARARGKGEGTVDHQLAKPGELLFYTSTRPEDGGDTDAWAAVPDVDFPLIHHTDAVPLPFTSRFGRSPKQPDARVSAVSLARGRADVNLAVEALPNMKVTLKDLASRTGVAQALISDGLGELRMQVSQARARGGNTVADVGAFAAEARTLASQLKTRAVTLNDTLKQTPSLPAFDWATEQKRWTDAFQGNLERQLAAWAGQLDPAMIAASGSTAEIARLGRSALEAVCQQAHQRLDEVGFLPLAAMDRITTARDRLRERTGALSDDVLERFDAALDRVAARYAELSAVRDNEEPEEGEGEEEGEEQGQGREAASTGLRALQHDLEAVILGLDAELARFDADTLKYLADAIGSWFSTGGKGLLDTLNALIREVLADARAVVEVLSSSMPPLEFDEPDWDALKAEVRALLTDLLDALEDRIDAELKKLREELDPLIEPATGRLNIVSKAHTEIEKSLQERVGPARNRRRQRARRLPRAGQW